MELNENTNNSDNEDQYIHSQDSINASEISTSTNFEQLLLDMQNCLNDAVDLRNIVQNISSDQPYDLKLLYKSDIKNCDTVIEKDDSRDDISIQKHIHCLCRDKQVLINQVKGLNIQMSILKEDNRKLRQELESINSKNADLCKTSNGTIVVKQNGNNAAEIQLRPLPPSFLRTISLRNSVKDSNCKSSSWSELRTNQVVQDYPFTPMYPLQRRINSTNNTKISNHGRIFGKKERTDSGCTDRSVQSNNNNNNSNSNGNSWMDLNNDLDLSLDFTKWSTNQVCIFLRRIGLRIYVNNCEKWLKDGRHLIESSKTDIKKGLKISNKLHLKKLLIHIRRLTSHHVTAASFFSLSRADLKISSNFNIRLWLDNIGLMHYIGLFSAHCIDGHVLDQISLDDMDNLKINNELHLLSFKWGIQLLRTIDYDLSVFIRRPSIDGFTNVRSEEVCRWTQHQVAEWIRFIELPEYASNIRGSGLHGALFIFEDRFNANSLASILNIPFSKSLLRRHLQVKFHELIGSPLVAQKRAASENPGFVSLCATSKVKFQRKRGFFGNLKRLSRLEQIEELLLPFSSNVVDVNTMNRKEN